MLGKKLFSELLKESAALMAAIQVSENGRHISILLLLHHLGAFKSAFLHHSFDNHHHYNKNVQ